MFFICEFDINIKMCYNNELMKKEISLKFLNEFCNSDILQKKFLDYENNKVFFPNYTKEEYYSYFISYYVGLLEEELCSNSFNTERFNNFYNNMIINYTERFPYYFNNEITNCFNNYFNRIISYEENYDSIADIVDNYYSSLYDMVLKRIQNEDLNSKYLSFRNKKMDYDNFKYISSKYLAVEDKIDFSYDLINEMIKNNYEIDTIEYLEIFKGFTQSEAKRIGVSKELDVVFCEFDEDSNTIANHCNGIIRLNIKYLKSSNIIENMISFYHELTHFLRDKNYLDDDDKLSIEIKKEELLIEDYDNYYKDNYKNIYSEKEARFMSYKFLLDYIEKNVPSKLQDVKKIIKKEFNTENIVEDYSDARVVGSRLKSFDQVFDDYVKNNLESVFCYSLMDEKIGDYLIHTYDCLGNRRSIANLKENNNFIAVSEKTSKKELFKYLINFNNINDSFYKEKLKDFFTEYTRMYYSYIINNIGFRQSNYNKEKYMDYILSDNEDDDLHVKKLSKKSNEFIRQFTLKN